MLITPYLHAFNSDPETKEVVAAALEMTRAALGLADDFANGLTSKLLRPASATPISYVKAR